MHGPAWVGWLLVLLGAAAGVYCLVRARTGPVAQRGEARGEGLMALGMAAMAWPLAPPSWSPWLFTAAFGTAGLWALARRHLHHAVGALAMAYMAVAMVVPSQRPGHTGQMGQMSHLGTTEPMAEMGQAGGTGAMAHVVPGGVPLLTGLLLVYFTGYVLAAGVRLVPAADAVSGEAVANGPVAGGPVAGDPVAVAGSGVLRACRVAMGIGMLAMLLAL
ncbi:DUF5134 domain-containing protein [Streptomyces tubercidicus]|uniref:DUF5134 domain-containing protein n=1 Tax=Streptomyces tubercidicus TaxID=47759 RepID=UPI003466E739